jgi:hypothetical protein
MDSVSRSPVFQQFTETLGGLETIRAYRMQPSLIGMRSNEYDTICRMCVSDKTMAMWCFR